MQSRSISRELALLLLGQISENNIQDLNLLSIEKILNKALDTLIDHWKEELKFCSNELSLAHDQLTDSEIKDIGESSNHIVRNHLKNCFEKGENIINSLSESIELSRLLSLSHQVKIREGAINRVLLVTKKLEHIDLFLDDVMEGWRLKRLPRIDRDILRLAFVDLNNFNTPIAVACNEAVNLANRYSDETGRRMINGILRRMQNDSSLKLLS